MQQINLLIEIGYVRACRLWNRYWRYNLVDSGYGEDDLKLLRLEDQALEIQLIMAQNRLNKLWNR